MAKVFVVFVCFAVIVGNCWAALPSVCLSELIRPSSGQCCTPQPLVEIGFYLRFGCDVPSALDQGVRLEVSSNSEPQWLPIRFYTPSLNEQQNSTVTFIDNDTVNARALHFNSDFPLHFVNTSEPVYIREYLCGGEYTGSNSARFRWMQRYSGISQSDVSTWSIDSVTVSVWDGTCLKTVLQEGFESASFVDNLDVSSRAGNVSQPPCGPTHTGSAYYFNGFSDQDNSRRSITIKSVDLTGAMSQCQSSTSDGECTVSNTLCDSEDIVCSRGSFQCGSCPEGRRLEGVTCEDIDECIDGTHSCQGLSTCVNTLGSYQCDCPSGYRLGGDGAECEDIDECTEGTHSCQDVAMCMNTLGSFRCDCPNGYRLTQNNISCEDINECKGTHNCQSVAVCRNTPGSFRCDCPDGYRLSQNNVSCEEINECTDGTHNCQEVAECRNTAGSYQCDCPSGYRLSQNNVSCEEINECTDGTHNCQGVAECRNTAGSYQCDCPSGYRLSGNSTSCEDIDECVEDTDNCGNICTNTPGSFVCGCPSGYVLGGNGTSCEDIDECTKNTHSCQGVAMCMNTPGFYHCYCPTGYRLTQNNLSCEDIDECAEDTTNCEHECTNIPGSFQCGCRSGYSLGEDLRTCQDINECTERTHSCQGVAMCMNTVGSFRCDCPNGYRLTQNNLSCKEIPPIVIGFERERYLVREETGTLTICLRLISGDLTTPISLMMGTTDGTATAGLDYVSLLQPITFSNDTSSVCADVGIIDDDQDEGVLEYFFVAVTYEGEEIVVLRPNVTRVNVNEQDGAVQIINEIQDIIGTVNSSEVLNVLRDVLAQQMRSGEPASREFSEQFLGTTSNLLSQLSDDQQNEPGAAEDVLNLLDTFALQLYDETQPDIVTDKFTLNVKLFTSETTSDREVGIREEGGGEISLPQELLLAAAENANVKVASFFFNDLSGILPSGRVESDDSEDTESVIGSPVISSTLGCGNENCPSLQTPEPVRIVFKKKKISGFTEPGCFFYSLTEKAWSSKGCEVNEEASNDTYVVCDCNHLTHFAILLSPNLNISDGHEFALQVIGYVFGSISFVCLVLTVVALLFLRTLWGMRNYIHVNLCINLFIAQLIFVIAVDKTGNEKACQAIAIILHYFFMVTFMWMLMEGVVLYVALVRVFIKKQKLYMIGFTVASYGLPLIYMCLTVPLGLALKGSDGKPHYGSSQACWLRYDTNFVWAFIAPVILIIMANIGFFFMAVWIMYKHEKKGLKKATVDKVSHWLKTSISLLVIMGITWIIGVLVFHEALLFVGYIFTILVACQGLLIFILFVPVSKQVRESYKKWWRGKVSESEFLSKHFSSSDGSGRRISRFSSLRTSSFRLSRFSFRSSRYDPEMQISKADSEGPHLSSPPLSPDVKVQLQSFSQIDESVADITTSYTQDTSNGVPPVNDRDTRTDTSNGVPPVPDSTTAHISNGGVSTSMSEKPSQVETESDGIVPTGVEGTDSTETPAKRSEQERKNNTNRATVHVTFALPKETSTKDSTTV